MLISGFLKLKIYKHGNMLHILTQNGKTLGANI